MELIKEKALDLMPATSAYTITKTGVLTLANLINGVLLALLLVQLGYVVWKWRRDYKDRDND